jgi:hypothetical protein
LKKLLLIAFSASLLACKDNNSISEVHKEQKSFPLFIKDLDPNRELSAAMKRSFNHYEAPRLQDNELYTNFKYTKLKGFDYNNGDGTITRRDPSKIILENGKYYVWYTHRVIHDPYPLVRDGKIYVYYKSGMGESDVNNKHWDCWGLAIADAPEGPFVKHPLNPVMNSGHEVSLFPNKRRCSACYSRWY